MGLACPRNGDDAMTPAIPSMTLLSRILSMLAQNDRTSPPPCKESQNVSLVV